jgi:hypothetical protein
MTTYGKYSDNPTIFMNHLSHSECLTKRDK